MCENCARLPGFHCCYLLFTGGFSFGKRYKLLIKDDPHFELAKSALLNAYCQARPTEQAILETLPLFMLARSFTYVGWVHTRPGTQTAEELTPALVEMSCGLAEQYLA